MAQKTNRSPVPSSENTSPRPCSNGCGFFGVPNTNGMCSVCYKEHQSRSKNNGRVSPPLGGGNTTMGAVGGGSISTAEAAVVNKVIGETTATLSQQMTEMSLVCEDKNSQLAEPSANVENTKDSSAVVSQVAAASAAVAQPVCGFTVSSNTDDPKDPPGPTKPKTNRCFMCRKKVGLTGFDCRCGNQFCGIHRYSDKHNCPYDYKAEAAAKIRKENPAVVADKIQRI